MGTQGPVDQPTPDGGFTGVVWQSRPTEKLAADLVAGSGPAPLAEAGLAWAVLGEEVAQIGVEYARVLANLGIHWESLTFNHAFEKLMQLAPWFADTAGKLLDTAARAEAQAAANTVALATMPSLPEVVVTEELADLLAQAGVMLGAPIAASGAKNDRVKHELAQRAARVMESYEQATVPAATPWKMGRAPEIVSAAALNAERAAAAAARQKLTASKDKTSASKGSGTGGGAGGIGGVGVPARQKTRYVATSLASVEVAPVVSTPTPSDVTRTSSMGPMGPMMAGAGQSGDSTARSTRTASASKSEKDEQPSGVRLPEGWLSDDDGAPTSWTQVAARMDRADERALLAGEGVLNLGPTAPAVLGAADRGDDR